MITLDDINQAATRIAPYVRRTDTVPSQTISRRLKTHVYLKLELFQKTGSFKPRAAFSKMLRLTPEERGRGIVAVSGGNFAQGVAYAATALGLQSTIFMPIFTPRNYVEATQGYGAQVELMPDIQAAFDAAEQRKQHGAVMLHPFDDPDVMAGSGSVALELLEDVPQLTDVFVSVGGGGLLSAVTIALKSLKPDVRIWSVETEGADALDQALKAGHSVPIKPTSLARTLGAPYAAPDAVTIAQKYVTQHTLVSDKEAYEAQRFLMERAKIFPELSASCTLAAAEKLQHHFSLDSHVALIMCGGNVSLDDVVGYKNKFEAQGS
jgi:threonine dehydratase